MIDLDTGTIIMGGSADPTFYRDEAGLSIKGTVTITGASTGISHFGVSEGATSDLTLNPTIWCEVFGNTGRKNPGGSTGWDSSIYSLDSYLGGVFCSAKAGQTNKNIVFGLNTDPTTDSSYTSIDYAWYVTEGGVPYIYESGDQIGAYDTYNVNTIFSITYDGVYIRYLKDGAVIRSVNVGTGIKYAFDSSFYDPGAILNNIRFGPMTNNDWSSVGGTGKPEDGATAGATWGSNITSQPSQLSHINSSEGTKLSGIESGADVTSTHTANDVSYVSSVAAAVIAGWRYADTTYIDGGDLYTGSVTAAKITCATLAAIVADMGAITAGSITLNSSGFICTSGKTSYADADAGFWLGYDTDAYKFNIGNASRYLKWDGASLTFTGIRDGAAAGDMIVAVADAVFTVTPAAYTKVKEIKIGKSGTYRIKFDMYCTVGTDEIRGKIYKNGVAAGTERIRGSEGWGTLSEDISGWVSGDLCQLYAKQTSGGQVVQVRNFRIYDDKGEEFFCTLDSSD